MEIKIESLDTIHEAAKLFINNIGNNKVFAFYGKMGVGKTTFTKAICEVLGVQDVIEDILPENAVKVHIEEQPDGTRIVSF